MRGLAIFLVISLLPTICFGLMFSVEGNRPVSEANYKAWPHLADVVNDPARVRLVWCNGDETLHYRGNPQAINRLLQKFAKVEADELRVIVRPALKNPQQTFDASVHVVAGLALTSVRRNGAIPVEDEFPTLTIFLTENLQLKDLAVPKNLVVEQIADLRRRYETARKNGNAHAKASGTRQLELLEADADRKGEAAKRYSAQLQAIEEWAIRREAKIRNPNLEIRDRSE